MSTRYSIPHLSESDGSVILQSYSVMMRYNKGSLCDVSRSPHPHAHTYMHTHTHSQWSLYGTETFYPLSVKKNWTRLYRSEISRTSLSVLHCVSKACYEAEPPDPPGRNKTEQALWCTVLPSPGISENFSPTVVISEVGQDGTSLLPFPGVIG